MTSVNNWQIYRQSKWTHYPDVLAPFVLIRYCCYTNARVTGRPMTLFGVQKAQKCRTLSLIAHFCERFAKLIKSNVRPTLFSYNVMLYATFIYFNDH